MGRALPAQDVIALLGLEPHPEGGFFRETFRSPVPVRGVLGGRAYDAAGTAIYYLLPAGAFSAFHRLACDEMWHHYAGAPVDLHVLGPDGGAATRRLGPDLAAGERPQILVPGGLWQAAEPAGEGWALCGCTVSPGFESRDLEFGRAGDLCRAHPGARALIRRLARP